MRFTRTFLCVAALAAMPSLAVSQSRFGTLVVTIAGEAMGESAMRLRVSVHTADAEARFVRSDSGDAPRLVLTGLPVGRYQVETRAIGYLPDTSVVEIGDGAVRELRVDLGRITSLDAVTIAGTSKGHLAAFERRRATGKGTFLTRDDIERGRRNALSDVLRSVRGLRVDCGTSCKVHMVRSTNCSPRYFANGFPTDASILNTPILDVAGIEIYRGPSETPGEFLGSQSMCGAIVVWTR